MADQSRRDQGRRDQGLEKVIYQPIGIIRSPFQQLVDIPIQPSAALGVQGRVEVNARYREGLADLVGFSHLILIYHFHQVTGFEMKVVPFLDTRERGLFATRAPKRPNPIGLSIVELLAVEDRVLRIANVDVLDRTPLLDIKPYVPYFDRPDVKRAGWVEKSKDQVQKKRSDDRFL